MGVFNLSTLEIDNVCKYYLLQDSELLILQNLGVQALYGAHQIGCNLGVTLKCEKKKSPVSH